MGQSESSGEITHLIIGRVISTRGLKGEVKVKVLTDFPSRFASLKRVYLGDPPVEYEVESVRLHQGLAFLKLRNVDTVEHAESLRGQMARVPVEEAVPLAEDQYYWYQIIGLEVWTAAGEFLGKITDILETGANDVYVVQGNSGEVLVPAIAEVVKEISLEKGRVVIEPLPGMLD